MSQLDADGAINVWQVPASGKGTPRLLVRGPTRDLAGALSPDGRWLVYLSDETGRLEAYVQSFPEPGQRQQISQHGAVKAWWTPDGRQLLFVDDSFTHLWRADVQLGATLRVGAPIQDRDLPARHPRHRRDAGSPTLPRHRARTDGTGVVDDLQNWAAGLSK